MQNGGWIKLHRKILEWEWYGDPNVVALFMHLLLTVNYEPKNWQGMEIQPGQKATTVRNLAQESGLTVRQTRTVLDKLKSTNEIAIKTTPNFSLIEIKKWIDYQDSDTRIDKRMTNERQTNDTYIRNKEIKNKRNKETETDKRERTSLRFVPPSLQEIENYCLERKNRISPQGFFDFYESKGWMIGKNRMKDWKAAIRTWERKEHGTQSEDVSASLRAIDISKAITTEL